MQKLELCNLIINLIQADTTPEELSDGEILDLIYDLVSAEL